MTYRTTKCPYCKFTLDYRAAAPLPDFMPSLLPCPKCGNIYATGKKLYCEMTKNEKDKTFKKFCGKLSYLYLIKDI